MTVAVADKVAAELFDSKILIQSKILALSIIMIIITGYLSCHMIHVTNNNLFNDSFLESVVASILAD